MVFIHGLVNCFDYVLLRLKKKPQFGGIHAVNFFTSFVRQEVWNMVWSNTNAVMKIVLLKHRFAATDIVLHL